MGPELASALGQGRVPPTAIGNLPSLHAPSATSRRHSRQLCAKPMELSPDQRERIERNRAAALQRRAQRCTSQVREPIEALAHEAPPLSDAWLTQSQHWDHEGAAHADSREMEEGEEGSG